MRICPNCGHAYPSSFTGTKCKFCGTFFNEQYCIVCKRVFPKDVFYTRSNGYLTRRCPECNRKNARDWDNAHPEKRLERVYRFMNKRAKKADLSYNQWIEATSNLQSPIMSEDEWLETCRYFGGCAICGNEHIESRQFFIPFNDGGKYTSWNMFPLCGKCAAKLPLSLGNPFRWFDRYFGNAEELGLNEERRQRLIKYLQKQVNKAKE